MLESFQDYLNTIELPRPLTERAEQICYSLTPFIDLPVQGFFVSDFFEPEGARRYTSFCLCTPTLLVEAKNFTIAHNVDFTRLSDVRYVDITRSDIVDLDNPGPDTTMTVQVRFALSNLQAVLTATRNNCRFLRDFVAQYLMVR
jgi:hypothetical protein